jgi:hypothetical protein
VAERQAADLREQMQDEELRPALRLDLRTGSTARP